MTTQTITSATLAAQLHGHGWLDWATASTHLAGATCAWADYHGFHIADCPEQMPHTSHLWAWRAATLWRLRLDSDRALVAQLTILPAPTADTMDVKRLPGLSWPPGYEMIGEQPGGVLDDDYDTYEVPGDPVNGSAAVLFIGRAEP